ncbi:spore protease YyaC [Anaerosinus massiliensis]|uniref:spore protease YyaC n=1 Tax=Massilibacillus massiliensis TaxID=1806837 RepID=UPI000A527EE2|nr:spore protease YyaC [Massilibacillus massiliensis]
MLTNIFKPKKVESKFSVHTPTIIFDFATKIQTLLYEAQKTNQDIVFVCIGTDRSTGDALGPLTGTKLKSLQVASPIFGTLEEPVHATNLIHYMNIINEQYQNPFIIAIDACLGKIENVGYLSLGLGSVKPGAAVKKDLPPVGDAYITGIVNVSGFMEHLVLQSTRLNLVMTMADTIAKSISFALRHSTLPTMNASL